jgi:hypothetical protein
MTAISETNREGGGSGRAPESVAARSMRRSTPRMVRHWIAPMVTVALAAMFMSGAFYALDVAVSAGGTTSAANVWQQFVAFNPDLISDALPALGMTIVAALGIVLTVVAIIVQLSSDRYTGVALMFLRDPVNILVMSFYIVASLCAVWLSVTLGADFVPRNLLLLVMVLTSVGLAVMLPYFAYVFWFLEPGNIIDRLRLHTSRLNRRGLATSGPDEVDQLQGRVLMQMEEIADIANNSIDGRDKIVAGHAVDALRDFLIDYVVTKPDEDRAWFRIGRELRDNPNFVAMDDEAMRELEDCRLWVEWKTLRQYLGVYNDALQSMQEINSLVAIDTRYIGEAAAGRGQPELIRMVFRFMNSYLRSAINRGSVRTAYNVLHQYRMLLEELLRLGHGKLACEGVAFIKYYGQIAFDEDLIFVTETVAYDIAELCRFAHRNGIAEEERILRQLLDVDAEGPTHGHRQERGLRAVRKAQTKLAAYYLSVGDEAKARMIADDMRDEPIELHRAIRNDLAKAESPHFWEIVDRGRNFEYLPEAERVQLNVFLGWAEARA